MFSCCFFRWCIISCLFIVIERLVSVACQSYTSRSLTFIYLFVSCFFFGKQRYHKASKQPIGGVKSTCWHWKHRFPVSSVRRQILNTLLDPRFFMALLNLERLSRSRLTLETVIKAERDWRQRWWLFLTFACEAQKI